MTMSTSTSNTQLKQLKASNSERINGKVKIQTKADPSFTIAPNPGPNATSSKAPNGVQAQEVEGVSPEQRRRASGRPQMTPEEQKLALRKRVEQFIPTINVRNSTTNILAKYKDATPSFIIHLHPTHFRFDQQDSVFSYNSPMKAILECIRDEQIPHEVADIFKASRIKYYDACLIVEVRDHRPLGQPSTTTSQGSPFITPSQNVNANAPTVPTPSKDPPRVYRTLLRPTEQSLWQDFGQLAENSGGEFTDWMGLQVEGGLMLAMNPRLVLDLPRPGISRKRLFERVYDQVGAVPPRKKVKRESSRAADDSAERAAEEKTMLLGDIKHDKDFQPRFAFLQNLAQCRFQILVHKEDWKKKKADEENIKPAGGANIQGREAIGPYVADLTELNKGKPKAVTVDSIQAQAQQPQNQPAQNRVASVTMAAPIANPGQLQKQQVAQAALTAVQPQPAAVPQVTQRRALPRVPSQEQLAVQRGQAPAPNIARPLQPTVPAQSNAPTPMSSSPQVPIQRLPATPRNVPSTPRPPGTPQPTQSQKPTPQPTGQAMTPVSAQPSPMLKSASQTDEPHLQQPNGARQYARGQQALINGVAQPRPTTQPTFNSSAPLIDILKQMGIPITYEQFINLPQHAQAQLMLKVQENFQRTTQGNMHMNPQGGQGPFQPQTFLHQGQRHAAALPPGQTMTPEQQRIFAQNKQQFLGGADSEMLRQQLAQQGRMAPNHDVQAMLQQQLLARQQNAQQQQQPPNLAPNRQITLQQQPGALKHQNVQTMTPQQVQAFRNQQLQLVRARATQANNTNMGNVNIPLAQQFMASLSSEQRAKFTAMDPNSQNTLFHQWANQSAPHAQHQAGPQLQYNPMAAQTMPGPMMGIPQVQGIPNGVAGHTMARQSTAGGGG